MIDNIGIIGGSGIMGAQIALALIAKKVEVYIKIRSNNDRINCLNLINSYCENSLWVRYLGKDFDRRMVDEIIFSEDIEGLKDCNLVIETVTENLEAKLQIITELNLLDDRNLLVATNTSSILISELSANYKFPDNYFGLHFFNPISSQRFAELTFLSSNQKNKLVPRIEPLITSLNKSFIIIDEKCGGLINRLIIPFWMDAVRELDTSDLLPDQIDKAFRLALNHPMGPLETIDICGLDTIS